MGGSAGSQRVSSFEAEILAFLHEIRYNVDTGLCNLIEKEIFIMLLQEMLPDISAYQSELIQLISDLCRIPAPSHKEQRRAAFCKDWLERAGFSDVLIDEACNVLAPLGDLSQEIVVFMAHTDTVFPEETELPQRLEDGKLFAPGVGDDTANLANLMFCARYALQNMPQPPHGILFVCNSCEEGLGNLKGSRQLMKDYGTRVKAVYSFDGYMNGACNHAVGSHRYRVTIKTEGGHSYGDFGNQNAIAVMAAMIEQIYRIQPPKEGKTTYNVGAIEGGTSVNTIAQKASMLFEYRSDSQSGLSFMKDRFESLVQDLQLCGVDIEVKLLGERPGMPSGEHLQQRALEVRFSEIYRKVLGKEIDFHAGSTDCNIPLSMGIPAICCGTVLGGKPHTYEEWISLDSLADGLRLALSMVLSCWE